jgi:L-fuculose-phosphate aldolase
MRNIASHCRKASMHAREKNMNNQEYALRRDVVEACRKMNALGINQGTSGNISLRCGQGLLITPSGIAYDALEPESLAFMRMDGSWEGPCKPSSEWHFHLDILRHKQDVQAVVHCHPTYATIMSIMGRENPAVHYMVAAAGGTTIPCAPYATFGSPELSAHALEALQDRSACLLAHHGLIATGPGLEKALWVAVEVEALARQYHGCLQIGEPPVLPEDEMRRVLAKFRNYGLQERDRTR